MSEHENTIARLAGRTRYSCEELRHLLEQGLSEAEIIRTSEDEDFAQALEIAAEIREAAERLGTALGAAEHFPEQRPRLLRVASCAAERLATEGEDLAILLFEPDPEDPEECVNAGSAVR
jgi:hypothetical protein